MRKRFSQVRTLDPELKVCDGLVTMIQNLHLVIRDRLFRNLE